FRHHRAGELLELHRESQDRIHISRVLAVGDAGRKNFAYEIENGDVCRRASTLCQRDRAFDVADVSLGKAGWTDIGAIHGEARDYIGKSIAKTIQCEIAGAPAGKRDVRELIGQHIQLAGQGYFHDEVAAVVSDVVETVFLFGKVSID